MGGFGNKSKQSKLNEECEQQCRPSMRKGLGLPADLEE